MKTFVVSVLSYYHNKMVSEKIQAESWKEALLKHPSMKEDDQLIGEDWLPDDYEAAQEEAFNADIAFSVLEI